VGALSAAMLLLITAIVIIIVMSHRKKTVQENLVAFNVPFDVSSGNTIDVFPRVFHIT
jgi:hypothetical protein